MTIALVSLVCKLLNAWFHYGFFSGDDVEIHEMTFARLFGWTDWRAWELRNAFFPMVFIYPLQAGLRGLGIDDPAVLIFSGRLVVAAFSTVSIWLVWKIAARLFRSGAAGLLAAFFLAFGQLGVTFGSSELPRMVAAAFILTSFWLLLRRPGSALAALLAGGALGVAAALRFSEGLFVVPCFLFLLLEKRYRHAVLMGGASLATGLLILGLSDWLYWGEAFFSLRKIVRFTLVERLSTRGYQSVFYYFTHIGEWTNLVTMALIVPLLRRWKRYAGVILWGAIPLFLLSLLPHQEARYLIPAFHFFMLMAGGGAWLLVNRISSSAWRNRAAPASLALLLLFGVGMAFLFEADRFRFYRSEAAVDMARCLNRQPGSGRIAIEQKWCAGGRLYLGRFPEALELIDSGLEDRRAFSELLKTGDLAYVALKQETLDRLHYRSLFQENGYVGIDFPTCRRRPYVLFKREP